MPNTRRAAVAQWVQLKLVEPGITQAEAAKKIGLAHGTLKNYISQAMKEGWLKLEDPMDRMEHEIVPKATENIIRLLDSADKTTAIEVFKGAIAPLYREAKGLQENSNTVIALRIEQPDGGEFKAVVGKIVGKPRTLVEDDET